MACAVGVGGGVGVGVLGEESGELGGGDVETCGGLVEAPVVGVEDVEDECDGVGSVGVFGREFERVGEGVEGVDGMLARATERVCDGESESSESELEVFGL